MSTKISWLMLVGVTILSLGLAGIVVSYLTPYFRYAPIKGAIINVGASPSGAALAFPAASIGDNYAILSAPYTSQVQFPNYPYKFSPFSSPAGSSIFIGGYLVASGPINFTITSLLPNSPIIFKLQNVQATSFLFPNAYFPWFFKIEWENSNNMPLIIFGQNFAVDPITSMSKPLNPIFILSTGLVAFSLLLLSITFFETKMEEKKRETQDVHGSFSEILNVSFITWKLVFSKIALPFAILIALQMIIISTTKSISQLVDLEINLIVNPLYSSIHRNYTLLQFTAFITPILYYLVLLFSFLLPLIAVGMTTIYAYDYATQNIASLKESLKTATKYSGKMLGAFILLVIILITGLAFLVVPGIYLAVILSLVMQVIIIEKTNITKAISRSIDITCGQRLNTLYLVTFGFAVICITLLLVYLAASILMSTVPTIITQGDYFNTSSITLFINSLPAIIGFALIISVITVTTLPFINIIMTIWYIHLNK
ncbi:MAG: hypothetical protein QXS27_04600 [Candidatus Jordarchaeaceae archaeon]